MGERRYIISEVAALTGLEAHVLRYWEDELGLAIPRNELGHRYYRQEHIDLFCNIKELKDKGYQLKAIKYELAAAKKDMPPEDNQTQAQIYKMPVATTDNCVIPVKNDNAQKLDKMEQFKAIIGSIVTESLRENNVILQDSMSNRVSEKVIKEMDYLLRLKEESEEERFKRLDETIRSCQKSHKEAACGSEGKRRRKRK